MPDDVPFSVAVLALFLGVLALLLASTLAVRHGGRRGPFVALGLMFIAVAVVVLTVGA